MNNSAQAGIAGRHRKYDNEVPEEKPKIQSNQLLLHINE